MTASRLAMGACIGAGLVLAVVSGCTGERQPEPTRPPTSDRASRERLRPVLLPDLSQMSPSVQTQLREQHEKTTRLLANREVSVADLGTAFGEFGKLLLVAQCFDAAEPALSNARSLLPSDGRWPYYLGQLARLQGQVSEATTFFEESVARRPDDVTALIWLGEMYLAAGRPDDAEPPLQRALQKDSGSVAARYRLGRVALTRRDYAGAGRYLEEALALAPNTRGLHYPLGLAYRGLRDEARAQVHLAGGYGREGVAPPDPLMQELEALLDSPRASEIRGVDALDRREWSAAASHFRHGLELDPRNASLRQRLGTALYMMGDAAGAHGAFEQALAISPTHAQSHYSLGVLLEADGRPDEALHRYAAAARYEPSYIEARLRLAGLLRNVGRLDASLAEYQRVLRIDPRAQEAALGYGFGLAILGRYKEARQRLEQGAREYPGEVDFSYALARVLAAAPDATVRDGQKALAVVTALSAEQQGADGGETMAMALAAVGQFGEAAGWQRGAIAAAERAGQPQLAARLTRALRLYEKDQPCRSPWQCGERP